MEKVKLQKGNRIIVVSEDRKNAFLKRGYDAVDKKGKVIEHATGGATVEIAKYNKVVKELEEAKAAAQDSDSAKELEEAKKEITKLKSENTRLKKQVDEKAK